MFRMFFILPGVENITNCILKMIDILAGHSINIPNRVYSKAVSHVMQGNILQIVLEFQSSCLRMGSFIF